MTEEWRVYPRNADYEVSSFGRVRSRDHMVWGGPRAGFYIKKGRVLRPGFGPNLYPTVSLGRGNSRTVHSLVAETFIGPVPEGQEVRHKDGERWNAFACNLEYGTRTENIMDSLAHGTFWSGRRQPKKERRR